MARVPKPRFKEIESLSHDEAKRRNIPTAEMHSFYAGQKGAAPLSISYPRATPLAPGEHRERNPDLDPQLVWRGKDEQDWSDLVVHAPPLYIQEKVHPKVIVEDLKRQSARRREETAEVPDLFADFNGLPDTEARLEFYQHDQNWSNRMILGDSLQVMASLAEREGLRGQVQCIYIDPPYGIRFNSNWQVSTHSRDVKDGRVDHISREPEQIKAFRDTWKDGKHSYLTYLRDRLTVAHDLLHDSGSLFVQIGDDNVHIVSSLLDELFGPENYIAKIAFTKTSGSTRDYLGGQIDYVVWYGKNAEAAKFRPIYKYKNIGGEGASGYNMLEEKDGRRRPLTADEMSDPTKIIGSVFTRDNLTSQSIGRDKGLGAASWFPVQIDGNSYNPSHKGRWKTNQVGMERLKRASRLMLVGSTVRYVRYIKDFAAYPVTDLWDDTSVAGFTADKRYVVETSAKVLQRCILMTTDPGDLVLDPTCGSGTTAYVAEQWGRRWITIDTSRVALALARARIMGARYPYYLLADSEDGRRKEAEVTGNVPADGPTYGDIRQGFVYERVPHITLKSIANNTEIDVIWEKWQATLEPLRAALNQALGESWEEWQIPREPGKNWPPNGKDLHARWWEARIAR